MRRKTAKTNAVSLDRSQCGFTAIELLMSFSVFLVISVIISGVFFVTQLAWSDSTLAVKLQNEMKQAMQAMTKELKAASPSSPIGITITPPDKIEFAIPLTVDATSITAWTKVEYYRNTSTNELIREEDDTATSVVAHQISALNFTQSSGVVTISLTATGTTSDGKALTASTISQATLRN